MLLLALTLVAAPQSPAPASTTETYVARFERALEAFDEGEFARAAELFEAAGEASPDAPVWRASAGVARAHSGDSEAAREQFGAALEHGYPASDLGALHPLGAEVADEREDDAPPDWVAVTARGLRDVHGDHRTARLRPKEGVEPPATHFVGLFDLESVGERGMYGSWDMEEFLFDRSTGRIDRVAVVEKGNLGYDGEIYCMPDRVDPWPRAIPLVRALRTGLLVDVPGDPIRSERQFQIGARWARTFDAERLRWTDGSLYSGGPRRAPIGFEICEDPELDRRAAELLPAPDEREVRVVARLAERPGARAERFLVANCWSGGATAFLSPREPILLLGPGGEEVLGRIENPVRSNVPWGRAAYLTTYDPARDQFIAGFRAGPSVLLSFDLNTGEQVWSRSIPKGRRLEIEGGWFFLDAKEPSIGQIREIEGGKLILDGGRFGLHRFGLAEGGRWFWGMGRDSLALFSVEAVVAGGTTSEGEPPEPLVQLWDVSGHAVAVACDGTWSVPRALLERDGRVLIGDRLEPALEHAPWLLDPLHVRTIDGDGELRPRRFPSSR